MPINMPVGKVTWTADGEWVNTKSYGQNCVITYKDEVFVTLRPVEAGVRPANDGVNYRLLIKSPFIKPLIHSSNTFSGRLSELNGRKVLFTIPAASISLVLGESQGDECWFFFIATAGIQITMGTAVPDNITITPGQKYVIHAFSDAGTLYWEAKRIG